MAVNGTGSLVVLVIVLLAALTFQAQVEGKAQDDFKREKEDNVSRIIDNSITINSKYRGPNTATEGKFPWQVYVKINEPDKENFCGGSIIDQQWIMSAAHCFVDRVYSKINEQPIGYTITATRIRLYAGVLDKQDLKVLDSKPFIQERVYEREDILASGIDKRVFIHKDYNTNIQNYNDIALFKLEKPLVLTNVVRPILLATIEEIDQARKTVLTVSGWGKMSREVCEQTKTCKDAGGICHPKDFNCNKQTTVSLCSDDTCICCTDGSVFPKKLRYVDGLKLKPQQDCRDEISIFDMETMLCQMDIKKETYRGDSGGALFFETDVSVNSKQKEYVKVQVGIVSYGVDEGKPGLEVFTSVAKFRPWIHKTMAYSSDDSSNKDCRHGFFRSSGSCFKLLKKKVSWEVARSNCNSLGLRLAEPSDDTSAVELRKDTIHNYGDAVAWIGARGDSTNFVFSVSEKIVLRNSPLLHRVEDITRDFCLILNVEKDRLEDEPSKPYDAYACWDLYYPLCEDSADDLYNNACPEDGDFFVPTGSKQCFKILKNKVTWEDAKLDCEGQGLELAHPFDSVQLRSYIVQRYGSSNYHWLGAKKSTNDIMTWERFEEDITTDNPLWYDVDSPKQPQKGQLGCLLLLSTDYYWKKSPERPYWDCNCKALIYPICELVLS